LQYGLLEPSVAREDFIKRGAVSVPKGWVSVGVKKLQAVRQ
jgi:hypothetical protein